MSEFWRHLRMALTASGPYDPTGRDQEIARLKAELTEVHRSRVEDCMVVRSGRPIETDEDRASEFAANLVRLHQRSYGTWPPADRVAAALDALDVPRKGERIYPRLTVDREADSAYLALRDRHGLVAKTPNLGHGIVVDLDGAGMPLGYEVLALHGEGNDD